MTQRQIYAVLGALMLGMLLAALDQTIVATSLPTIVGDLGGLNHLSWVVTAYLLDVDAVHPALREARRPLRAERSCSRHRSSSSSSDRSSRASQNL